MGDSTKSGFDLISSGARITNIDINTFYYEKQLMLYHIGERNESHIIDEYIINRLFLNVFKSPQNKCQTLGISFRYSLNPTTQQHACKT